MPSEPRQGQPVVAAIVNRYTLVLNRGADDGIRTGQKFLVYGLSDFEIEDPETGDTLGQLEIVRGTGKATHVQPKVTTIYTDEKTSGARRVVRQTGNPVFGVVGSGREDVTEYEDPEPIPFKDVEIGDLAKRV